MSVALLVQDNLSPKDAERESTKILERERKYFVTERSIISIQLAVPRLRIKLRRAGKTCTELVEVSSHRASQLRLNITLINLIVGPDI